MALHAIDYKTSEPLFFSMPNYSGKIEINGVNYPVSHVELSKPTGKYVYRVFIKLFNLFSRTGYIRTVGNTCAPGFIFPNIDSELGFKQIRYTDSKCGVLVLNVLGQTNMKKAATIPAEPFMVLKMREEWNNFQDYLQSFSSKYRVRAQKVLKNSEAIQMRELTEVPGTEWISECGHLLSQSLQDKTVAIGQNLSELLFCFKKSMGSKFRVFGYYLDNELVGFISVVTDHSVMYATHLGMKSVLPQSYSLYSRMMLDLIYIGIGQNIVEINFGRTATEIKSTLGAVPIENSFVIFSKSKILLGISKLYAKWIHKKPEYQIRNPFK